MITTLLCAAIVLLLIILVCLANRLDNARFEKDVLVGRIQRLEMENASLNRENETMNKSVNLLLDAANTRKLWRSDAGAPGLHTRAPAVSAEPRPEGQPH